MHERDTFPWTTVDAYGITDRFATEEEAEAALMDGESVSYEPEND